jgi:hypothetical protein
MNRDLAVGILRFREPLPGIGRTPPTREEFARGWQDVGYGASMRVEWIPDDDRDADAVVRVLEREEGR